MRVRIVVADQAEARYYDSTGVDAPLEPVGGATDPAAHLHDRDFKSDRPGRVFDHAPTGQRRGATAHHSTGGENTPRKHEAEQFARRIMDELESAANHGSFERLVIIAKPPFLGALRAALPARLKGLLALEIGKDLVHEDARALRAHLPPTLFH